MLKKKIFIFGTGEYYFKRKLYYENNFDIIGFLDNNLDKWGTVFESKYIYSPEDISKYDYDFIFIASTYFKEIKKQLIMLGVEDKKIMPNGWYVSQIDKKNESVVCSYVNTGFYMDKKYATHGNAYESVIMRDVFNELGFNYYSVEFDDEDVDINKYSALTPKIVIGQGKHYNDLCRLYPNAIKINYATGSFWKHTINIGNIRVDNLNKERGSNVKPNRINCDDQNANDSDYILQIGSKYTIDTYPAELQKKIFTLRQSTFNHLKLNINDKINKYSSKNYLWFASSGNVLKGLDLVLDYFKNDLECNLYIVGGPIEKEFEDTYRKELYECDNIKYYGYLPIYDNKMIEIANKCAFVILPSCSEGGMPGSVLNMMKLGLIPIVSKYAACDEIEQYGILIEELTHKGVFCAIEKSKLFTDNKLISYFTKCNKFICNNFTEINYKKDLKNALINILN